MKLTLNRVFLLVGAAVLALTAGVAFSLLQVVRYGQAADAATLRRYQSYLLADELRQSSDDLTRLARTFVVSGDPKWEKQYFDVLDIRNGKVPRPKGYERIYWDFLAAGQDPQRGTSPGVPLTDLMKAAGFTDAEFGKLNEAKANSDDLVRTETVAMNMVKGLYDDGKGNFTVQQAPDAAKAQAMMHDLAYHQNKAKIMKPVDEFLVLLDERTAAEVAAAQHARTTWGIVSLAATALLCAMAAAALAWARRMVFRSFGEVRSTVEAIAAGDLTRSVHADEGGDVVAQTMRALRSMQESLRRMITQIRSGADAIATGSAQIASGNQDLSQRTEEQASNLEQTASATEQLTATVKQNADTARQAAQYATSAATVAEQGGQVVGQVVATMEQITASSKKIADIIGVIDAIAFQTNILALNAAVEAARAGEQGRGFAVVAAEVRSLARRSADAAKEIKDLISSSVSTVDAGGVLVGEAGRTMGEIVAQVRRVNDLIGEISAASTEQSEGVRQIGDAMGQLDQVTQQNAGLVEECAAAADSLQHQATQLSASVAVFRIGEAARPAPAAASHKPAATAHHQPVATASAKAPAATARRAPAQPAPAPAAATAPATADDWAEF